MPKAHNALGFTRLPRVAAEGSSGMDVAKTLRSEEKPMAPNKRRLGTTDLENTTVGFGAWAIGGGVAVGWPLACPGVTGAIVGARSPGKGAA